MHELSRGLMKRMGQFLVVLAAFAVGTPALAQTTGAVSGVVTASTGLALPGVTVTLRNAAGGSERTVPTQTDGSYLFTNLSIDGNYEIQADLQGFASVVHSNVTLKESQRVTVDFTLFAASAEALVVTGRVATLVHQRSTIQQLVPDALVHSLPLNGRSFMALTSLTAGFTGSSVAPSPQGQIYWSNNVVVDGASHFSKWRGAARTFYSGYGLDSIREVQVLTSQFSAEFGEALATVTIALTNSGTNTLRSSAFIFGQAGPLNDRPAFTPRRPPFSSERFGGTSGGPVIRDRTHFFASYEGNIVRGSKIVTSPAQSGAEAKNTQNEELFFFKVDHRVSRRDLLTARYSGQWFNWHDEPGGLTLVGSGTNYKNNNHTFFLSDTGLLSNRMLNQARFQFSRYTDLRRDLNPSPYVERSGYSFEGGRLGPYGNGVSPEDTLEASNTLSYVAGAHSVRFGGGFKHVSTFTQSLPFGFGSYYFAGDSVQAPQPYAFYQELAASSSVATTEPTSISAFGFAQDDWTLGPRLTLNAGLRYDVERVSNLRHYDVATDKNNIQPRLGVAWEAIPSRMVVRGGVGLYTQQQLLGYLNRVQLDGADGAVQLSLAPGSPVMPVYPSLLSLSNLSVLPPRDIRVIDPNFRNPYSVQATIGAEHSLFGMVVGTDFVYLRGFDLMSLVDTNAPASTPKLTTRTVAQADLTRPILPIPNGFRKIISLGNEGLSWYRGFEIKVDRSVGRFQAVGSYTFAHANDRANDVVNDKIPEDSRNIAAETGRADNDVRHNLSLGLTWQLPESRPMMRGVTLAASGLFRSSRPYTITFGDDRYGTTQNNARPGARNTGVGDSYQTIDLSLSKRFRAATRNFEGRIEAFNVLSTVNFDEHIGALSSPYFGQPVSAFPSRAIQLVAIVRF
jgi:carboxypeptidase family protein/TonB-dependent receptor-like protein